MVQTKPAAPPQSGSGATIIPLTAKAKAPRRGYNDRWTAPVMKLGHTPVPNLLLRAQAKLGLTPEQLNVLLQITEHWWDADRVPYPSKDTLARRMGRSPRQVQRYITQLEDGGFLKRVNRYYAHKGQTSNGYDLSGLIQKLVDLEPEFRKIAEQNRLRRQRAETAAGAGA